jgi:hypothetical protein
MNLKNLDFLEPLLCLLKIIAEIANLGSKKAGVSLDFWENCMNIKTISIGERPLTL